MIDKLDIRVPGNTPFTESFARLYGSQLGNQKRWKSTKHYSSSSAWDDIDGLDVTLHMECQMTKGKDRMHKIEILRTGEKTYDEMVGLVGRVFETDPERLAIMRVDLTADVEGVPVDWFKRHVIVRNKQTTREHGVVPPPYLTIRKGRAETLYAGVKPNQVRIYDKVAERRMQYGRYLTRFAGECAEAGVEPTTFEAMYGHDMNAVITRVERQIAARDIEKMGFSTVQTLHRCAFVKPFEKLVFFDRQHFEPCRDDYTFEAYCTGKFLQQRVEECGLSDTLKWLQAQKGAVNFDRAKKKYAAFLRVSENVAAIDSKGLQKRFEASVTRQLLRAA